MIELFYLKFDPDVTVKRDGAIIELNKRLEKLFHDVTAIADDIVLRKFFEIINACLRTNFFQNNKDGSCKDYVSFKLNSKQISDLPSPKPYAEIYVYSTRFEAIHLRGGKVARGGLRWSDRTEDFRTEILGLVKAQMTKNSIIIPVGSKGGFVVKKLPSSASREIVMLEVTECYKNFLRGLLDVTDNIVKDKVVSPTNLIRYDDDDPYLVVAADKGTATFSDTANSISKEYNFWLGDAFASGGSVGYDHKKMGITAKGAWVSVQRHFYEMDKDIQKEDFTCIGIGDMAGDVFGNGMLLSEHIKLIAAFNHLHIFIDPNPNPEKSFKERQRLFQNPRLTWEDYDKKALSKGAQIYSRGSKSLKLTPEIKARFKLTKENITPDELIKVILKADVELLWNGGIGTYVKSSLEENEQVGDKANDALRINGSDLRCKVVGEGGNLGFTQLGRIEFAQNGGKINTDSIDNSAGVDCSDHEVNIKIALDKAVERKKLNSSQRNKFLESMTDEVAALCLRDNELQTLSISVAEYQGLTLLEGQERLVNILEKEGILEREVEFLPSAKEFIRRINAREKLTRPELSVLLSYSKNSIFSNLINSNVPDEEYFLEDLQLYFPEPMRQKYINEIKDHPLRREIIATYVTNSTVNRVGSSFFHLAMEDTGLKGCDIARSYVITRDLCHLREIWHELHLGEKFVPAERIIGFHLEIKKLVQKITSWFLRNVPQPIKIADISKEYKPYFEKIVGDIQSILSGEMLARFELRLMDIKNLGFSEDVAKRIAALDALSYSCDIVKLAMENNIDIKLAAKVFFELEEKFSFTWIQDVMDNLSFQNYWQRLSIKTLKQDFYDKHRNLTSSIIKAAGKKQNPIDHWIDENFKTVDKYTNFIVDLKNSEIVDFSMMVITAKRLESLFNL